MSSKIIVARDMDELAETLGLMLVDTLSKSPGKISFALSGGTTPKSLFDFWAVNFQTKIEWERIKFFWGDERCVPPDHPDSNYLMAYEHLFSRIKIPKENIIRIKGENNPDDEAINYSEIINEKIIKINNIPSFDLIMLGLGEDGHTASIFPNVIHLINDTRICAVAQHPESGQKRVTLTGSVINNARRVVFIAAGEKKSRMVDIILNKKTGYEKLPAANIQPVDGDLIWLLDKDAAKELK